MKHRRYSAASRPRLWPMETKAGQGTDVSAARRRRRFQAVYRSGATAGVDSHPNGIDGKASDSRRMD